MVDLPEHVVSCSAVRGKDRYGVKLRFPLRGGGQIRIGSTYADVDSAVTAVTFFQFAAVFDPVTKVIGLTKDMGEFTHRTVNVYKERGTDTVAVSVVEYVRDVLQRRMNRPKRVKRKAACLSSESRVLGSSAGAEIAEAAKRQHTVYRPMSASSASTSTYHASSAGAGVHQRHFHSDVQQRMQEQQLQLEQQQLLLQ